ncbi:MAG TPA: exosortase/archaeosortase family protein [Verrucomicrobiae bacterium]
MKYLDQQARIRLVSAAVLLLACFGWPLLQLVQFSAHSELFSYILLIPVISIYLVWTGRKSPEQPIRPSWALAAVGWIAGGAIVAACWWARREEWKLEPQDYLGAMTLAFLLCFWGSCFAVAGAKFMKECLFSAAFLLFMIPIPTAVLAGIDTFLQHTSAVTSVAFFKLVGEPTLREGLEVHLPGFSLTVAPECSGIHSTMVLLITSVLASHLFLRRSWTRLALVLAVLPLAIVRNGFRIFVVGELCVHISPDMIDSYIHRKGGPIFFALSLIPFFCWLLFLRKREGRESLAPAGELPQPAK